MLPLPLQPIAAPGEPALPLASANGDRYSFSGPFSGSVGSAWPGALLGGSSESVARDQQKIFADRDFLMRALAKRERMAIDRRRWAEWRNRLGHFARQAIGGHGRGGGSPKGGPGTL